MTQSQSAVYEQEDKVDRLEKGVRKVQEMQAQKRRGRVTFHLDGSGKVNEIEVVEKV